MDLPQPPPELELKNIIDKLAQFVARNGPEFEHMTKQKQKDNPKFSFLFGGVYFHYYQYRVTTEQAILKQKQQQQQQALVQQAINRQSIQTAPWQQQQQIQEVTSQEQIRQSEQNLAAQHQLLLQQQQLQVDEVIRKAQEDKLNKFALESGIDIKELDGILQPIIDSCTKDSISSGKGWIFAHATSHACSEAIVSYILRRVTEPGATFEAKLHLVYLVNDVLHHCFRKNAEDLKKILEKVVVPIFCTTSIGVEADKQQKLTKLFKLWESNKYFSQDILNQLQNPTVSLAAYQAGLIAEFAAILTPITTAIQTQYALLQKQHQDFVAHLTGQLQQILIPYAFQSTPAVTAQTAAAAPYIPIPSVQQETRVPLPQVAEEVPKVEVEAPTSLDAVIMEAEAEAGIIREESPPRQKDIPEMHPDEPIDDMMDTDMGEDIDCHPPMRGRGRDDDDYMPPDDMMDIPPNGRPPPRGYMDDMGDMDYPPRYGHPYEDDDYPPHPYIPPPYRDGPPMGMRHDDMAPDYLDPPPPCPPYYDLPAGLMVPLVKLEDTDYTKPLNPEDIRLPAPAMPTDRLLAAVEQFYCPPTHERTRVGSYVISSEGWEQLGLYEFFKAKTIAKKQKGLLPENIRPEFGIPVDALNSPHLPPTEQPKEEPPAEPKRRKYREIKSPEPDLQIPVKNGDEENETIETIHRRSMSRSPEPTHESRSPSPPRSSFQRSRGRSRSRSGSPSDNERSPGRSPDRKSVSPPSFVGGSHRHERRLDESNKGHQLLKKMGWSGAGLGATEQGIQDPVDAGDIRDRQDMYKGVGVSLNDPYENFRKSKGQAFINRMKARAEELSNVK